MKKSLFLLLTTTVFLLTGLLSSEAAIINVPAGQPTITAAITAASPGDIIIVAAGIYNENINITKTLTLQGAQSGVPANTGTRTNPLLESIINGTSPVAIKANNVVIDGFTIQGSDGSGYIAGIWHNPGFSGTNGGFQILNNIIQNNVNGISAGNDGTIPALIQFNLIQNNNNPGPGSGTGIRTDFGLKNAFIDQNTFINNQAQLNGYATSGVQAITFSNNEITGTGTALYLLATKGITVTGNNIHNNSRSISLAGGDTNVTISNNFLINNTGLGIRVYDAYAVGVNSNVTVNSNSISNNTAGNIEVVTLTHTGTLNATCNWYGTADGNVILSSIAGDVNYTPWLTDGTDGNVIPGFQPSGTCNGTPVIVVSAVADSVICGSPGGSIVVTFSGGTANYTIDWGAGSVSSIAGSPYTITGLAAGPYTITVTDTNGTAGTYGPVTVLNVPVTNVTQSTYHATIQGAINAAVAGDVISVCAGTYTEAININKSLTLLGAQANNDARTRGVVPESILNYSGGLGINASSVIVNGFTIRDQSNPNIGPGFGYAIYMAPATTGTQLLNNIITNNIIGSSLANTGVAQVVISQNWFDSNNNNPTAPASGQGIYTDEYTGGGIIANVLIDNNKFSGHDIMGIDFSVSQASQAATGITISNNDFLANGRGVFLYNVNNSSFNANVVSSTAYGDVRIYGGVNNLDISNNFFTSTATYGIRISDDGNVANINSNVVVNDNSFVGYTATNFAIQILSGYPAVPLDANCNWWGSTSQAVIAAQMSGSVDFTPWLVDGTDSDLGTRGFQPVTPSPCSIEILSIAIDSILCGDTSGSITLTYAGGLPNYTISWTGGGGGSVSGIAGSPYTLTNLPADNYVITITDTNGFTAITASIAVLALPVTNITQSTYHATIQGAINAAVAGDIISVCAGTYNENVDITKTLTLLGAQFGVPANTGARTNPLLESIINGTSPVAIKANNVVIDGFTIQGSDGSGYISGIWYNPGFSGTNGGFQILNNIIQNNVNGISAGNDGTIQAFIKHNLIQNNNNPGPASGRGLGTDFGLKNAIIDSNAFINNQAQLNGYGTSGVQAVTFSNNEITALAGTALFMLTTSGITVTGNYIHNNGRSISVIGGNSNLTITNNFLINNTGLGIRVADLYTVGANSNVFINSNDISNNTAGNIQVDAGGHTGPLNATCNWYGTTDPAVIAAKITGSVTYAPWLVVGTDIGDPGFIPGGSCTPVVIDTAYVTDSCVTATLFVAFSDGMPNYVISWTGPVSGSASGLTGSPYTITGLSAGTYKVKVTSFNGSVDSVQVIVNTVPLPVVTFNLIIPDSICNDVPGIALSGGSPAGGTFSGPGVVHPNFYPIFLTPGNYTITYSYTSINGCTNSASRVMRVIALPVVTHPNMSVCADKPSLTLAGGSPAGGTYSGAYVTGNTFNAVAAGIGVHNVTYTYTKPVVNGCTNKAVFTVTVHALPVVTLAPFADVCADVPAFALSGGSPAGGTYSGPGVTGGTFNPAAAGTGVKTIKYKFTNANGCSDSAFTTITVLALPVPNLGLDKTICLNDCAVLTASGGGTYLWSTGSTTASITVCPPDTMLFTVTVTSPDGCIATEDIKVNVKPLPIVAVNSPTICPGTNATLTATGGSSYSWSGGLGTGNPKTVSPAVTTVYTVTATGSNGCTASATATVTVLPAPTANAGPDVSICKNDSAQLNASGGVSYAWSPAGGLSKTNIANPKASPASTQTYVVTVTAGNGCTATDNVVVTVLPLPIASAGPDVSVCKGLSKTLTASGGVSYIWSNGTIGATNVVSPSVTTTYTVTVTGSNGCSASVGAVVTVLDLPLVNAGNDTSIMHGDTLQINASVSGGTPAYTLSWTPALYLSNASIEDPKAYPPESTSYILAATDQNGCSNSDTLNITVTWDLNGGHGIVYYLNEFSTPLPGVLVTASSLSNASPRSSITDGLGHYLIDSLSPGVWLVTASADLPVGFINATDALRVLMHTVGIDILTGLPLLAADVNASGTVNTTDAMLIAQYFAGLITEFPAGKWVFEQWQVTLASNTLLEHDLAGLAVGDVNGSFVPAAKSSTSAMIEQVGTMEYIPYREISIPVMVDRDVTVGAISMEMNIPADMEVRSISCNDDAGILQFTSADGKLRISWLSVQAMNLRANDVMLTINGVIGGGSDNTFALGDETEIVDAQAVEITGLKLIVPQLVMESGDFHLQAYPVPATQQVYIEFNLPEDMWVNAEIFTHSGQKVMDLYQGNLLKGEHQLGWSCGHMPAGIYFCRFSADNASGKVSRMVRIVVMP